MALQGKYVGDVDRQSHEDNSVFYSAFHGSDKMVKYSGYR
jgi:hypothetical protein